MPLNDLILIDFVNFYKIAAPPPDPDDQIPVILRVQLRVLQFLGINRVQLKLMPARLYEGSYQRRHL